METTLYMTLNIRFRIYNKNMCNKYANNTLHCMNKTSCSNRADLHSHQCERLLNYFLKHLLVSNRITNGGSNLLPKLVMELLTKFKNMTF